MTNAVFAKKDEVFLWCCRFANAEPTRRQASKYRSKKGRAYAVVKEHGHKTIGRMIERERKRKRTQA